MGDEVEEGGTGTFGCSGDGVPEESFVIQSAALTVVQLEDAVFPNRVRDGGRGGELRGGGSTPSRVGVEAGQALVHRIQANSNSP
jgi:hypothetical protein